MAETGMGARMRGPDFPPVKQERRGTKNSPTLASTKMILFHRNLLYVANTDPSPGFKEVTNFEQRFTNLKHIY